MKSPGKILLKCVILVFIVLFLAVATCLYYGFRAATDMAISSYVASVNSFLQKQLNDSEKYALLGDTPPDTWRVIDTSSCNELANKLSASRRADRGRLSGEPEKIFLDAWDRYIMIGVRYTDENKFEFIVWSKGRDGLSGTDDDIVYPYRAEPPAAAFIVWSKGQEGLSGTTDDIVYPYKAEPATGK